MTAKTATQTTNAAGALASFLAQLESEGMTPRNREAHRSAVERLQEFLRPREVEECAHADVRGFLAYLGELGVSPQSQAIYSSVLDRWMVHLVMIRPPERPRVAAALDAAPAFVEPPALAPPPPACIEPPPFLAASPAAFHETVIDPRRVSAPPGLEDAFLGVDVESGDPDVDQTWPLNRPSQDRALTAAALAQPQGWTEAVTPAVDAFAPAVGAFAPAVDAFAPAASAFAPAASAPVPAARSAGSPFAPIAGDASPVSFAAPPAFASDAEATRARSAFAPVADASASTSFLPPPAFLGDDVPASASFAPVEAAIATGPPSPTSRADDDEPLAFEASDAMPSLPPGAKAFAPPPMKPVSPRAADMAEGRHAPPAYTGGSIPLATDDGVIGVTGLTDSIAQKAKPVPKMDETVPSWGMRGSDERERNDLSLAAIRDLVMKGVITPHTQVRRPGGDWMRAGEYHPLRSVFIHAAESRERVRTSEVVEASAAEIMMRTWGGVALGFLLATATWWLAAMVAGHEVGLAGLAAGMLGGVLMAGAARETASSRIVVGIGLCTAALLASRALVWRTLASGVVGDTVPDPVAFALSREGLVGLALVVMGAAAGTAISMLTGHSDGK